MAQFKRLVPFQIRALRKQRGWSQEQLAENARVTQGVVSRAEDSDNGNLTVNTILRLANGFDSVFVGQFMPYSQFLRWYEELTDKLPPIPSFEEEFGNTLDIDVGSIAHSKEPRENQEIIKALQSQAERSNKQSNVIDITGAARTKKSDTPKEDANAAICGNPS